MQTQLEMLQITYPALRLNAADTPMLRGAFAGANPEALTLHNHGAEGLRYRYPTVQYKIIREIPHIIAFGDGVDPCLATVRKIDTLRIGNRSWQAPEAQLKFAKVQAGDADATCCYRFATPWLALNQENHQKYAILSPEEQRTLLESILTGNIISFAKGLGLQVENYLQVNVNVSPLFVPYKGQKMLAFVGTFTANYLIPPTFGIGKGVSRGFGAVIPARSDNA